MKTSITILIILFAASSQFCYAQLSKEALVRELENSEREAILKGDTASLFKMMSPDIVVQNPVNQIITLPQIKERLKTGRIDYSSFERITEKVTFIKDLAIAMGKEIVTPQGATEDAGKTVTRRYTNIWVKDKNGWKLIARQATIISVK